LHRFNRSAFFDAVIMNCPFEATCCWLAPAQSVFALLISAQHLRFIQNNETTHTQQGFQRFAGVGVSKHSFYLKRGAARHHWGVSLFRVEGVIAGEENPGSGHISPNGSPEAKGGGALAISGKGIAADDGERYQVKASVN
jgi:hypothetical protein